MMCCHILRLSLCVLLMTAPGFMATDVSAVGLDNCDCIKCHNHEATSIDTRGQKHKGAIACLDCHLEHPPSGVNVIPECAICHDGGLRAHYAVKGCVDCHNPHAPLEIDFGRIDKAKPACISCHDGEGAQLTDYPSLHSELDCAACHLEHGNWLSCLDCHDGHSVEMTDENCLHCHKPHMPSVVRYDTQVPNRWCSGCHGEIDKTLAENQTRHHDLPCVYCHKEQHLMMPSCETCHAQPHGVEMHKDHPDCRECHFGPHALTK